MPDELLNTTLVPENSTLITEFSNNETVTSHTEMTTEEVSTKIINEKAEESKNENSKESTTSGIFQQHMYHIYNGPI